MGVSASRARSACRFTLFRRLIVPALGFFNVYPFIFSFVADHFQYLASLGIIAFIAGLLGRWNPALSIPVVAILGVLTLLQSRMYSDSETLYRATIARNAACWMAYNNLGLVVSGQGRAAELLPSMSRR